MVDDYTRGKQTEPKVLLEPNCHLSLAGPGPGERKTAFGYWGLIQQQFHAIPSCDSPLVLFFNVVFVADLLLPPMGSALSC
jgi:hypothetical protein